MPLRIIKGPYFTSFHFTSFHFTSFHFTSFHLHFISLHFPSNSFHLTRDRFSTTRQQFHILSMDHSITSEAGRVTTPSSNPLVDEFLTKIGEKAKELNTNGITRNDQEILNHRLSFNWANEKTDGKRGSATLWRNTRARRAYAEIQDANEHLFLVVVLVIPPTECAKTSFDNILNRLISLENYEPYFLSLSSASKRYFESTAAEQGFAGSRRYLSFMQALFPQSL